MRVHAVVRGVWPIRHVLACLKTQGTVPLERARAPTSTTTANRQVFSYACLSAGASDVTTQQIEWRVPLGETTRLLNARSNCDTVRFTAALEASVSAHPGQEACLDGTWSVVNLATTPATVLSSDVVAMCEGDLNLRSGDTKYFAVDLTVPPTANVAALGLRWEGEYRFDCWAPSAGDPNDLGLIISDFETNVAFPGDLQRPAMPLLEWDCWPGWDEPQ